MFSVKYSKIQFLSIPNILLTKHNLCFSDVQAVLMDLDGTLIDTLDLHIESFQWILKRLGKDVKSSDLEHLMGRTPNDIIQSFLQNLTPEEVYKAANEKEEYLEGLLLHVKPYQGVTKFLMDCKNNNVKTVVISSTYKDLVFTLLRKAGLLQYIDEIVSGDEISRGKPDPEPFLKGLEKSETDRDHVVGFGDSIFDAYSCTSADIRFIPVLTGKTTIELFLEKGFDKSISSFKDVSIVPESVICTDISLN